ncbi:hypothetical protein CERSUDRAFT_72525 [Gelatoporia subvermispora B]|uniref:AAA+ ATPase domain-containing protein n=1 Tax=Ceriporiopsis subvermispora (strain B) TaxID=914234 RepID=M2PRW6_CERS8|nr:hypothetical protein CERSUDRAFT_72525 [Gelatoporia subvermispora B]
MDTIKGLLSPLTSASSNAINDTVLVQKLVVIGGTVETARRMTVSAWNGFVDSFFLTAHFSQEDYPYDWYVICMLYDIATLLNSDGKQVDALALQGVPSQQPAWGRSREFDITTRSISRHGLTQSTSGDLEDEEEESDQVLDGRRKRKGDGDYPQFGVVARNNDILKKLVLEAKREYEKDAEHRVHIFMADTSYGCWRWNGARQKRPMSSIVLEPGVKDMILADCKDFLCSEDWYAERGEDKAPEIVLGALTFNPTGIPFRRGYLLHGVPGSGKTSLIHSLAGELGLDIYVVSLSSKGMSDNMLSTLMGNVPSRCILLLEDLDAAFTRGVSRDEKSTGTPTGSNGSSSSSSSSSSKSKDSDNEDGSTLSLSGLLNSLDGVAAAEGRLLFATTNHIERLDPALSRPGRMDVWVNFKHATKWQAEGIFKCFFPAKNDKPTASESDPVDAEKVAVSKRKRSTHVVPLLSEEEISELAKRFAAAIPENELSVAALQGYLLKNKTRPRECVEEVAGWIVSEREMRAKLKKEKEEREAKEKKEAEELAKKESEANKKTEEAVIEV